MGGLGYEDGVIHYYLFQRKITQYFNKVYNKKDENEISAGYIINPNWIKKWKNAIQYNKIEKKLIKLNINQGNLKSNEDEIKSYIEKHINKDEIKNLSNTVKTNNFDIIHKNIFSRKFLTYLMPEKVFKSLKIHSKISKIKIKYILKNRMIILILEENKIIKIIIPDTSDVSEKKDKVNLSWKFYRNDVYNIKISFLKNNNSQKIIDYLVCKDIFSKSYYNRYNDNDKLIYTLFNEELNLKVKYADKNSYYSHYSKGKSDPDLIIKQPKDINFDLAKKISFRGLDNVGATCYMNATLQNLANIKPITDYLLNVNKYSEIYDNVSICTLTLQYCQVLLGLFCDKSNKGSYSPKLFKTVIGEMNPLFQGVQANDSKDLIIFLLEVLNSELSKLHNKKNKIKKKEDMNFVNIDSSNEQAVLNEFLKNFKISHSSIIGDNLCGFQRNIFICQNCGNISNNFNIFNILIFSLEATANLYQLNNGNNIPVLTFDQCFNFLLRQEIFQDTYCQRCKISGNAFYKENLYLMPNYLIIILNRGKGNIFNCIVDIPLIFDSSNYEEKTKNKKYELIGVVSHFGESGMGGHFIAFCKHCIDGKWRCYNDCFVTECENDFLKKGIPYILFYKKMDVSFNQNNNIEVNAFPNNNPQNNNIFVNNQQQQNIQFNFQNMNLNNNNNYQGNINFNNQNNEQNMNLNNNNNFN